MPSLIRAFFLGVLFAVLPLQALGVSAKGGIEALGQQKVWLNASRPLKGEDLQNRLLVLHFWSYGCLECLDVMQDLAAIEAEQGAAVTVIHVHSPQFDPEKETDSLRSALLKNDIRGLVVKDSSLAVLNAFALRARPSLVLVRPTGEQERIYTGSGQGEKVRRDVARLVEEYGKKLNRDPLPRSWEGATEKSTGALRFPGKLIYALDPKGEGLLFISDAGHNRVLGVVASGPEAGNVRYRLGVSGQPGSTDGSFADARFKQPSGLFYDGGMLYVADRGGHTIRKADFASGQVTTVAGTGDRKTILNFKGAGALRTPVAFPYDVAESPNPNELAISLGSGTQIWSYSPERGLLTVLASRETPGLEDIATPDSLPFQPTGITTFQNELYFADSEACMLGTLKQKKADILMGKGSLPFGFSDGNRLKGMLQYPTSLFADASGLYVADTFNHAIRRFDRATGKLETIAGDGKPGREMGQLRLSRFNEPSGVTKVGDILYVSDTNNHRIQMLDLKKHAVRPFPVHETASDSRRLSQVLPNTKSVPSQKFKAGAPIPMRIALPAGWIWDAKAPSYLALFEMGNPPQMIKEWIGETLRASSLQLPPLRRTAVYRLQGTLHYCEAKDPQVCAFESRDMDLQGVKKSPLRKLDVVLSVLQRS